MREEFLPQRITVHFRVYFDSVLSSLEGILQEAKKKMNAAA